MTAGPVLAVDDLVVEIGTSSGVARPVDGVSFEVAAGETVALVGESGCGKTMTALAVLGLLPRPGRVAQGRISFEGRDLAGCSVRQLREIRGSAVSMVFQEPVSALNPVFTIGQQIVDVLRAHDRAVTRRGRGVARWSCSPASVSPTRRRGSTSTPTSGREECANAR